MTPKSILTLISCAMMGVFVSTCGGGGGGGGEEVPEGEGSSSAVEVSSTLEGKLIAAQDGEIVEAELTGDPEYYVLYHSASW